jgi:hypothetical protein
LEKIYGISLFVGVCLTLVYAFEFLYMDSMFVLSNVISTMVAGAGIVMSIFALRGYWEGLDSKLTRVWVCFVLGIAFWFLGELMWAVYALVLKVELPYPSLADGFWLIGYIPLFLALVLYLSLVRPAVSKRIVEVTFVVVSVIAVPFTLFLIIPATVSEGGFVTRMIDEAYPLLGFVLLALSFIGVFVFTTAGLKGKLDRVWILLNLGILMNVVGDSLFSFTTANGTYYNGHPLELMFHFGYLFFLSAFYVHRKEL